MPSLVRQRPAETVLRVHALDQSRTMAAVTTLLAGRGQRLRWLSTSSLTAGRILIWLGLPHGEVGAARLGLQLDRLTHVVHTGVVPAATRPDGVRVLRVDVNSSSGRASTRHESVVAVEMGGQRRLGAGEGTDRPGAVVQATLAAIGIAPCHRPALRPVLLPTPDGWYAIVERRTVPTPDSISDPFPGEVVDVHGGAALRTVGAAGACDGAAITLATLAAVAGVEGLERGSVAGMGDRTA